MSDMKDSVPIPDIFEGNRITPEFLQALNAAQTEMRPAEKNAWNPHIGKEYADHESVMEEFQRSFAPEGFSIMHLPMHEADVTTDNGGVVLGGSYLYTILFHKSGGYVVAKQIIDPQGRNGKPPTDQERGSSLTYAKRYGTQAVTSIVSGDGDDDGTAASGDNAASNKRERSQGGDQQRGGRQERAAQQGRSEASPSTTGGRQASPQRRRPANSRASGGDLPPPPDY